MAKILVIDDSEDVLSLAKQVLSEEYEVFAINSWVHATDYIFKHDIDLILLGSILSQGLYCRYVYCTCR